MTNEELKKYLSRTDIVIENNLAKWEVSLTGSVQGLYTGQFIFRCFLTPTQKLAAGRDYRELLGPNPISASQHEDTVAFTLSQLKYRIVSAPPFWTSSKGINGMMGDIPDENVLDAILEAAIDSECKYTALLQEKKEKALERAITAAENISKKDEE